MFPASPGAAGSWALAQPWENQHADEHGPAGLPGPSRQPQPDQAGSPHLPPESPSPSAAPSPCRQKHALSQPARSDLRGRGRRGQSSGWGQGRKAGGAPGRGHLLSTRVTLAAPTLHGAQTLRQTPQTRTEAFLLSSHGQTGTWSSPEGRTPGGRIFEAKAPGIQLYCTELVSEATSACLGPHQNLLFPVPELRGGHASWKRLRA